MKFLIKTVLSLFIFTSATGFFFSCSQPNKPSGTGNKDSLQIDSLTAVIRSEPRNPDAFLARAAVYYRLNNLSEAINDATIALRLDSLTCRPFLVLSEYYLKKGESLQSRTLLEKAVKYFPDSIDPYIRLADLYFVVKMYNKAFGLLADAQRIAPADHRIYFLKGLIYRENKETRKAIENLQICVSYQPEYYEAYILLGLLHATLKDSLALVYYDNALRIKPRSYEAFYNKAMFYQDNNDPENALKTYETISRQLGPNTYVYHNMGWVNLSFFKNYSRAVMYFDSAISLNQNYPEAYQNRAFCLEMTGKFTEAAADYKKVLEMVPNYELAIEGLNRIDKKIKKY